MAYDNKANLLKLSYLNHMDLSDVAYNSKANLLKLSYLNHMD